MRAKYWNPGDRRRDPEEISDLIGGVLEQVSVDADVRHGDIIDRWDRFAPGDWRNAKPVGVREGRLLVVVPDGATASLLRYQIGPLLSAIEDHIGAGIVRDVKLSVESPRTGRNPM